MLQIEELMDSEKRRQDSELERALKERIDKRRKALEAKHRKQIQAEIKQGEQLLKEELDSKRQALLKEADDDYQKQMDDPEA